MKASIVDLRYKMNDVLKALDRQEKVTIHYHGKVKGVIMPADAGRSDRKVSEHPFFGMAKENKKSVLKELEEMREVRYK